MFAGSSATKLDNFLQSLDNPDPKNSFNQRLLEIYMEWHQQLPNNSEAVFKAGAILSDMGEHSQAIPWYRKAIEMDRYFIMAYLRLAASLTELRQYSEAETIFLKATSLSPDLWDNYKEYGEFLLKRGRYQDALPVFKKGTELMPDLIPFWFYYKLCQVHIGDLEGAEATELVIQEIKARQRN
ncbi:TPR repeat-containing protein [Elysia marginata]|uniref:TPR repeat-containing protein n=1 Tax=Elysia marginata TaxID=1093978 RepID=A0AAV4FQC4_9GAST|nr:TPR repeat-containing protein [Elysia marginata]